MNIEDGSLKNTTVPPVLQQHKFKPPIHEETPEVEVPNWTLMRRSKFSLKKRFRLGEFLAEQIIRAVAFLSLAIICLLFIFVFREAIPVFSEKPAVIINSPVVKGQERPESYGVSQEQGGKATAEAGKAQSLSLETSGQEGEATIENLTSKTWQPVSREPKYGLLPLVAGTLRVTLVAVAIAGPVGILAAIFTAMFAPRWAREILKPAIEILAGFPSVVIGFFALITLASILQDFTGTTYRLNAFVGGIALSLAVIPIVFTITEDALATVPKELIEASLALGASRWQTAFFVVLPAATLGVFAALLLGIGRAFGETMIVLMATGNAATYSTNTFESVRTLTATIGAEMAEVVFGETHYNVLFLIGSLLFLFTFTLNVFAEFYVRGKLLKRFQGVGT